MNTYIERSSKTLLQTVIALGAICLALRFPQLGSAEYLAVGAAGVLVVSIPSALLAGALVKADAATRLLVSLLVASALVALSGG